MIGYSGFLKTFILFILVILTISIRTGKIEWIIEVNENKPIRLSGHAQQQIRYRGATEIDVIRTVRSSTWQPAELGRFECRLNSPFIGSGMVRFIQRSRFARFLWKKKTKSW